MLVTGDNLAIDRRVVTFVGEKLLEADMREVYVKGGDGCILGGLDSSRRVAVALPVLSLQWDCHQHNTKNQDTLTHSFIDTAHLP